MASNKVEKSVIIFMVVFLILVTLIVVFAHSPYIPIETIESTVFLYSSLAFFVLFLVLFITNKGTKNNPAGIRYFAQLWSEKQYSMLLKAQLLAPISCLVGGYFIYMLVATLPAYPTKLLVKENKTVFAKCIETGKGKSRGVWSKFKLENGEEWKLSGFGRMCPNSTKDCYLQYKEGYLGYYVESLYCS